MSSVKKVILRDFQIDAVNKLCLNEKTYNMGSVIWVLVKHLLCQIF